MRKTIKLLLLLFVLFSGSACSSANYTAWLGITPNTDPSLETNRFVMLYRKGGVVYYRNSITGQVFKGNEPLKQAYGCANSILYSASWGDTSITTVAREAGITKVALIEHETQAVLGGFLWHEYCVKIYGE